MTHTDPIAIRRIEKLPKCIQPHVEPNDPCWSYCPSGWRSLVEELHYKLIELHPEYQIRQLKEKYGGLRFYTNIKFDGTDPSILLIQEYEDRSETICDVCGEPGKKQNIDSRFVATRCDEHATADAHRGKVTEHDRE